MRNEIWSLVFYLGAPSQFIIFVPTDVKHPLAIYFANTNQEFILKFYNIDEHLNLIANNSIAGVRFFNVMINMSIKHVLDVDIDRPELYGDIAEYYEMVEQQHHLTLHLHTLV